MRNLKRINAVYCLIYNDENNEVLMVYNYDSNSWSLPGGSVEDGETLEEAAIREAWEEIGVKVKIGDVAAINECFFEDENEQILFITFRAEIVGGEISILNPNEISEIKWVELSKADELMPYHKLGVEKLLNSSAVYYFQK